MSDIAAPFDAYRDIVRPEWIDHNEHMNMGYYLVVFDLATDEFLRWVGLDEGHRRAQDAAPWPPQVGRTIGLANRPGPRPAAGAR